MTPDIIHCHEGRDFWVNWSGYEGWIAFGRGNVHGKEVLGVYNSYHHFRTDRLQIASVHGREGIWSFHRFNGMVNYIKENV